MFSAVRSSTPYLTIRERQEFLRPFNRIAERIPITRRDPKDDKSLELAVNGAAQLIITGDAALLAHSSLP
jgi:uncharacterized protein